jgi:hypothetical protein
MEAAKSSPPSGSRRWPALAVCSKKSVAWIAAQRLVLVQDTIWIQCGFADIAKVSDSCILLPGRDSAAQKQRGERVMTSILDFHDYPEIETDGVAEMSIVRHTAWLRMFRWRRIDGLWRAVVVAL